MEYIDGITGELITESALLKNNTKNIEIDGDDYQIMRTMLCLSNPYSYANNMSSEGGIMTFYTDEEYNQTKKIMKKLGLKFKDTSINNAKNDLNNNIKPQMSPYPSNNGIRKNRM